MCQHVLVHTACRAAQCLHCADAVLLLQSQLQCHHQAREPSIHRGWAREPRTEDVSASMAGPVQSPWERHDAYGLAFASYVSWGNWARMYPGEGQVGIFWENFSQGQEWEDATWYQFYGQSPQESLLWEALQPVQETWGCIHHTQYKELVWVWGRQKREIQFWCR